MSNLLFLLRLQVLLRIHATCGCILRVWFRDLICTVLQEAMRLYSSAVDKFEKVLAIKPDSVSVLVTCGLALKDMALCMSLDDPDTLINLEVTSSSIHSLICLTTAHLCCFKCISFTLSMQLARQAVVLSSSTFSTLEFAVLCLMLLLK